LPRTSMRGPRSVTPGPVAFLADVPPGDEVSLPPSGERITVGFHLGALTFVHRADDKPRQGPHPLSSATPILAHFPRRRVAVGDQPVRDPLHR